MESANLATLLLGIATAFALVLPLMLAFAGLVFQSLVATASELAKNSLEITVSSLVKLVELDSDLDVALHSGGYSDDDSGQLLKTLSSIDFHPKNYRAGVSDRAFVEQHRRFVEHLTRLRRERLQETQRRFEAMKSSGTPDADSLAYGAVMPRLERVLTPLQGTLEAFERQMVLYGDVLFVWSVVRRDLLRAAPLTTALLIAAVSVAAAAWTYTPAVAVSPIINAVTAAIFVFALAADLIWITVRLRPIAKVF